MRKARVEENSGKEIVAEKRIMERKIEKGESLWKYATGKKSKVDDKGRRGERTIKVSTVEQMIKVTCHPLGRCKYTSTKCFLFRRI
jgi:hypothetical protein